MFDLREINIVIEQWSVAFCAVCIVCCLVLVRTRSRMRNLIVVGLSLEFVAAGCDALAGIYRGQAGEFAWTMTHVGNTLAFFAGYLLLATYTSYLCLRIEDVGGPLYHAWPTAVWCAAALMCVLTLLGVHYTIDAANVYHRAEGYWMVPAFVVVVNGTNLALSVRARRQLGGTALACMAFYNIMPLVAAVAQAIFYGVDLVIVAAVFGFVVVFLEMQSYMAQALQRRTEQLAQAQAEAADSRIAVMVSQIQPHFLFNALDTIYGLVDEDTEVAKDAIASFSRYLRSNLESLRRTTPVPVETELEHVRTYLELERLSDEDRIAYTIDAQAKGFLVPTLAVQTLAENAVKHGVAQRSEGGHVVVRTRAHVREYTVTVVDDGVGFDVAGTPEGVGIANTRARVEAMCAGTLEIASERGQGTTATIRIPRRGVVDENARG